MRKPSDYAHPFGASAPSHWEDIPLFEGELVEEEPPREPMELATFRLLYESKHICLFETRDGHITAVAVDRLA
ncbi:MAG: hypothetical protein E7000_00900 [Coriobacteriaceae bacterium]|nr:hypothetical protein [Coriobacteriaceae bacterium]